MYDFLVIGDVLVDRVLRITDPQIVNSVDEENHKVSLPYPSKVQLEHAPEIHGGGNAYNMSIALGKLKSNVGIYTVVGNDEAGTQLEKDLRGYNINTELMMKDSENPTNSSYVLSIGSDRTLFSYHYSRSYDLPDLPESRYVLLTSIGEDDKRLFDALIAQKKTKNFQLIFSPGTRQVKEPFADVKELLENTDILILNKQEAKLISRLQTASNEHLLRGLNRLGPKQIVITRSDHGSIAFDGSDFIKVGALPVQVVEATGAGDTYAATVSASLAAGFDFRTAMERGALNSASVVTHVGCIPGMLSLEEMEVQHRELRDKLVYQETPITEDNPVTYEHPNT